jgi:hypothetical protein
LRERETVRADRRLRTDEKRIRARSAILDETDTLCLRLTITLFSVRMRFLSVRKTRLARVARKSTRRMRRHLKRRIWRRGHKKAGPYLARLFQ